MTSGSPTAETDRLLALGATFLRDNGSAGHADGAVLELADPDGNEFHLTT